MRKILHISYDLRDRYDQKVLEQIAIAGYQTYIENMSMNKVGKILKGFMEDLISV